MGLSWIKAILALPFNAAITIPLLILYFSGCLHFSKNTALICLGLALFLLGFFLSRQRTACHAIHPSKAFDNLDISEFFDGAGDFLGSFA